MREVDREGSVDGGCGDLLPNGRGVFIFAGTGVGKATAGRSAVTSQARYEVVDDLLRGAAPNVGRRRALGAVPSEARREVVALGTWRCDARCVWLSRWGHCGALRFLL